MSIHLRFVFLGSGHQGFDSDMSFWLVVTGTMDFYDFPFSWEFHYPN